MQRSSEERILVNVYTGELFYPETFYDTEDRNILTMTTISNRNIYLYDNVELVMFDWDKQSWIRVAKGYKDVFASNLLSLDNSLYLIGIFQQLAPNIVKETDRFGLL